MKKFLTLFCALGLVFGLVSPSSATLIGHDVELFQDVTYSDTLGVTTDQGITGISSYGTAVIGADVEFRLVGGASGATARDIDLTGNTISLIYAGVTSDSPDLFILDFGSLATVITGLTLLTTDSLATTTAFTDNSIGLLVSNPVGNGTVTYRIDTVVPEPTTLLLFGFGLLGLAGVSRKKG